MQADHQQTDGDWEACDEFDCHDRSRYALEYDLLDDDGNVVGSGFRKCCAYHTAKVEREVRWRGDQRLGRLTVFEETFDTWTPPERTTPYNIDAERELSLLADYLDAQDAQSHPALRDRRQAVEAALRIVRGESAMHDAIRSWSEPWKNRPRKHP